MSSFKKLRLDPELPPSHRNQSGAIDNSGGRGFLDGSSFSSSTSGGSGAYGRSSGPFRTRYSQPLGAASPSASSFSRFAPYYFGRERRTSLRVPLIRARREDSDSEGNRPGSRASLNSSLGGDSTSSATSSTAQRIIETLQNLSTPVMNAGKIRIDQDIKAVQPLPFGGSSPLSRISPGSSLNRSTGPPKMCSSLLLSNPSPANQTSPMFNSGDQRRLFCIPRMIDAATNTDKEGSSSPPHVHFSNKSTAASTTSQTTGVANMKHVACITSKDDNSEEEFHECSSEFTFSNPWTPDVFDRYLASGKEDKSISKGDLGVHQPLINGFKETSTSIEAQQLSSKNISSFPGFSGTNLLTSNISVKSSTSATSPSFSGFAGSAGQSGFGSTSMKDDSFGKPTNLSSSITSDASKAHGSSNIGSTTTTTASSELNKMGSSPLTGFTFGKPGSSPLKNLELSKPSAFGNAASKDAKTPSSVDKVDAPKTDSPVSTKSPFSSSGSSSVSSLPPLSSIAKSSATKWSCPECMVDNEVAASICVSCGKKNTNLQNSTSSETKPLTTNTDKKKWRCPTCMIENELEAPICVCCSEKKPVSKWRCPTCMVANDPTAACCVCCTEKNPNPVIEKKDVANAAGTAQAPTFKFGVSGTAASSSTPASSGSFVFGAPAQSDIQKSASGTSGFKFGLPSTTSSTAPASVSTTPLASVASAQSTNNAGTSTFKFGSPVPSSTVSSASTSTPTFGFNASSSTSSASSSSTMTTENKATTASSSVFSAPKVPESGSSSSTGGLFSSSNFQSSQSTNNSFKFGSSSAAATNDAKKSSSTPSFNFGAAGSAKPGFNNSFSFGDRQQNTASGIPGASTPIMTPVNPVPTPTPTLSGTTANFSFGSNNPTTSPFGQPSSNPSGGTQPVSGGLFQFGRGPTSLNSQPPSMTPAPAPSFSLTPNLNFGATPGSTIPFGSPTQPTPNAGSQPPPALFQFSSSSSTPSDSPGGRKIKKAVRRFNK